MNLLLRFCVAAILAALLWVGLSGCTLPKRVQAALSPAGGESRPAPTPTASPAAPAASSAAPAPAGTAVRLVVDGQDGENCRFGLYAYPPATLAPHVIAVDYRFRERASGESVGSGGIFVELPVPAGRVEQTPQGPRVELTGGSTTGACSRLEAEVTLAKCESGTCPPYVAGESRLPIPLKLVQP